MKSITKALVKGLYYTAKFVGQASAVAKEGAVDGYNEACKEIKQEECPFDATKEPVAQTTVGL